MARIDNNYFTYRETPTTENGTGTLVDIKGQTLKWNQLVQSGSGDVNNCTKSYDSSTGITTITPTSYTVNAVGLYNLVAPSDLVANHKYLVSAEINPTSDLTVAFGFGDNAVVETVSANKFTRVMSIRTWTASSLTLYGRLNTSGWSSGTFQFKNVQCIDLTQMGLDITDPSDFTSLFPLSYYDYNIGTLLPFKGEGIKTNNSTKIYGIRRQISASSPNWERTDDGVGLTANATKDGSSVVNNFDDIYPWSKIKTVNLADDGKVNAVYGMGSFKWDGSNGEVMTYIPSFWYKRWQENGYEYVQISQSKFDGAEYSKGFYVGRYTTSSGTHSKSGVLSQVSTNITNFRNQAKAKGDGWQQLDYHYCLIELLYLVEYANYNIQATLGNGNSGTSAQIELGGCDSLGMSSGCLANDSAHAVIYRGIENLYGNIWQFVDGVNVKDKQAYINYNQSSYAVDTFDGDYQPLGYINGNANGWQKELGYDADNQAIAFPTAVGGSSTTYMCDYYYQNTGNRIAIVGGVWRDGTHDGFCWSFPYTSGNADTSLGSRLVFNEENPLLENYSTTSLPISTYFPNGMNRVNDVYDELTESKATKRIGSRAYQSGDESDTSVLTDGTTTLYELSEYEETPITPELDLTFNIDKGGTEELLPTNTSTPTTTPILCDILYRGLIPVSVTVYPLGAGTVEGAGQYRYGETVTLVAESSDGIYRFLRYEDENGDTLSTDATYSFIAGE